MADENATNTGLILLIIVLIGILVVGAMYFIDDGADETQDINVDLPDIEDPVAPNNQ